MTLQVPSGLRFSQVTTNRSEPSLATCGAYESVPEKSTGIGAPLARPVWSNNWVQMSWSVLENALTHTATDVPVRGLALSDSKLSEAWGLRLTRCSEPANESRVRPSRDSRAGRLRRAARPGTRGLTGRGGD